MYYICPMKKHKLNIKGEGTVNELIASLLANLEVLKKLNDVSQKLDEDSIVATLSDGVLTTNIN